MPQTEEKIQNLSILADCITAIQLFQKIRRLNGSASAIIFSSLFSHAVKTAHKYFKEYHQSSQVNDFSKLKTQFKSRIIDSEQTKAIFKQRKLIDKLLLENKNVKKELKKKKILELEKNIFKVCDKFNTEFEVFEGSEKKKKPRFSFSIFGKYFKKSEKKKDEIDIYLEERESLVKMENGAFLTRKKTGKKT